MIVKIKKLHENAVIPKYALPGDAAMDVTAISRRYDSEYNLWVYDIGLAFEIPDGYVGLLYPRSSICKKDLVLSNSTGVLDSKFRGSVGFYFKETNHFPRVAPRLYEVGDRIGQIMIVPYDVIQFEESEELSNTERGAGGIGSTGT